MGYIFILFLHCQYRDNNINKKGIYSFETITIEELSVTNKAERQVAFVRHLHCNIPSVSVYDASMTEVNLK